MITEPKPYPVYRPVDEDWLRQIPESWSRKRLMAGFDSRAEKNDGVREKRVLSLSYGKIIVKSDEDLHGLVPGSFEGYQRVSPGDIIVRGTDLQNDQRSLRVGQAENHGIITSAYTRLIPRGILHPRFAYLLLHGYDLMKALYRYGSGLRQTLDLGDLRRLPILIPPPEDQAAIVRYLDHIDSRIQRFIAAKERLIDLLEEEKHAIIHRAVTRGLNSDAALKPAAAEGLDLVPRAWEIVPLKRVIAFQEGPGIGAADFRDEGTPLLRIAGLKGDRATLNGCNYLDPKMVDARWAHFRVRPGDYLLSASASAGEVVPASEETVGAIPYTGIIRLWPRRTDVHMPFVAHFLRSGLFRSQAVVAAAGVSIQHFGPTHLGRMWALLPPTAEQEAISEMLGEVTARAHRIRDVAQRQITLVLEYRTRLVSDVVTGKVDVREAATNLPTGSNADGRAVHELMEEVIA